MSCETLQTNLTPTQAQTDIQALGAIAKPYVSPQVQKQLHTFAVQLDATQNWSQLVNLLPHTGNQSVDQLVASITKYAQLGGPYAHAVAQGLLANF